MTKLPKRTKSQKIGVSAADLLSSVFVEFCLEINDNFVPVESEKLQVMIEEGELVLF